MRKLVILSLVAAVAVFLAAPSAFAKKALTEDELELITAAGEPKVVEAVGSTAGIAVLVDVTDVTLALAGTAQTNLNALVLNNVVGENQLANALNIQSVAVASGTISQTNTITQSWGSTKDFSVHTAPGGQGGDAPEKCILSDCSNAGKGGDAKIGKQSAYADEIVDAEAAVGFAVAVAIQTPQYDLTLGGTAQESLAALVVNNIAGRNQVANAVNIMAGFVPASPLSISPSNNFSGSQTNNITQYRGTPLTRPKDLGGP